MLSTPHRRKLTFNTHKGTSQLEVGFQITIGKPDKYCFDVQTIHILPELQTSKWNQYFDNEITYILKFNFLVFSIHIKYTTTIN